MMKVDSISKDLTSAVQKTMESGSQNRFDGSHMEPMVKSRPDGEKINNSNLGRNNNQNGAQTNENQLSQSEMDNQEQAVIDAIEKANKHFKMYDRRLEFSIHEGTKQIMVKVINTESDEVIREIPSEKILDMVAKMWEVAGIFIDEKR